MADRVSMALGAGTLFAVSGGVLTPIYRAIAGEKTGYASKAGKPLFVQVGDTHTLVMEPAAFTEPRT